MSLFKSIFIQISTLGLFWQEKFNRLIFRWNIVLIIAQLGLIFWKFNNLPDQVPLFYSLPWGESQLGSASTLFLLPTFSIVLLLVDNLFASFFLKTQTLLARLLVVTSLVFSIFSFITLFQIVNLIS